VIEVAAALLLAVSPAGPGCRQPSELARQLSTLAESRWTEWTPKRLRSTWLAELQGAAYQSRRKMAAGQQADADEARSPCR
jgi:hypothetical protein